MPKRILHVFGRLQRGGAELRTLEIVRHLEPREFDVAFLSLSGLTGELDEVARSLGAQVFHSRLQAAFLWRFPLMLVRERVDVIHSHVHDFSGLLLLLARISGVTKRIAHYRNTSDGHRTTVARRIWRWAMRRLIGANATDILAVSHGTMRNAWSPEWCSDRRCRVVLNGLDTTRYREIWAREAVRRELGIAGDAPLFIHVASYQPSKNHKKVVSVFRAIRQLRPDSILLFVGRGVDTADELENLLVRHGCGESVRRLGERDDVPRLLAAADVMVFPSLWEGLPGAVLEACAAGKRVVATPLPGIIELGAAFPTITLLGADAQDSEWAAMAISSYEAGSFTVDHDKFDKGPFGLRRAVDELRSVYGADGPC